MGKEEIALYQKAVAFRAKLKVMKRGSTRKILIVEDDPHTRKLYEDAFDAAGFDVCLMPDADDGFLERVADFAPDVISMDLMIGQSDKEDARDGFAAMEALKGDLRTHEMPVIVLSNFIEEGKVKRAANLDAVDYIIASSYSPKRIVEHFSRFLDNPKKYKAVHPAFRKE